MNEREREVKIKWFMSRTGADRETAIRHLIDNFWKINNAIADHRRRFRG